MLPFKLAAVALIILSSAAAADSIDTVATWRVPNPRPLGQEVFCRSHMEWCGGLPQTRPLPATPELMALLRHVNVSVNRSIRYQPDPKALIDKWEINPPAGDCDDYSVSKLAWLIDSGLPRSSLRLAVYRLPGGAYHAVLTVETTGGTVVLSNLNDRVVPWREVGADWIGIERVSSWGFVGFWELRD